jgi:hypothetical protein
LEFVVLSQNGLGVYFYIVDTSRARKVCN